MIVPFVVEPDALLAEDPLARTHHARLLEQWYELGVLTNACQADLIEAISRLPQQSRKAWQAAMTHFRRDPRPGTDRGVLFVSPGHARHLGVPDDIPSRLPGCSPIEVCRFDCADRSQLFRKAKMAWRAGIPRDMPTAEVWATYFADLARLSKVVVGVDRYAAVNLDQYRQAAGAAHLLRQLDRDGGKHWVTLISADLERPGWTELVEAFEAQVTTLEGGGIRELVLHLAPDRVFQLHAHDRHLRFKDTVVQLGKGLEVLQKQRVESHSDAQVLGITPALREKEKVLKDASRAVRFVRKPGFEGLVRESGPATISFEAPYPR